MKKQLLTELRSLRKEITARLDTIEGLAVDTAKASEEHEAALKQHTKEIDNIYTILAELVKDRGQKRPEGTVVPKEPFYDRLDAEHISRREALRTLREDGAIRPSGGKSTCVCRINGRPTRVLMVVGKEGDGWYDGKM